MATLTVKNVGPIREADIEVKKHTIFIGPQGTGKSTLAKLIAIGGDVRVIFSNSEKSHNLCDEYNVVGFDQDHSLWFFDVGTYRTQSSLKRPLSLSEEGFN